VIAYHFPPVGGAGVQRTVKFVRYLREFGYEPVVLTGPGGGGVEAKDETLVGELPASLEVLRVPGPEPDASEGWQGRRERWLRQQTPWTRWWVEGAIQAGGAARDIDLVFATMSPFQSTRIAGALARQLEVPWVADLRDPWVLDEMLVYETGLHRRLDLKMMGSELSSAAAVVMNTPEAASALSQRFPRLPGLVVTIPNGFDAHHFERPEPVRGDGAFRIVHAGLLHTELGEAHRRALLLRKVVGGAMAEVDILPRSHFYLLQAVERLLESDPSLRALLEVHLVGRLSDADRAVAEGSVVRLHGYVPYEECLEIVRDADLLFLPMADLRPGHRARIVPGKTYDYLASGRPILAAVPDGDARDLLAASGRALICRPRDVDGMVSLIGGEIDRFRKEGRRPTVAITGLEEFERRRLTARLADVFDRVVDAAGGAGRREAPSQVLPSGA
jgi:hypothetical protein